jgi:cytochrome c biogenesis protein CcdA
MKLHSTPILYLIFFLAIFFLPFGIQSPVQAAQVNSTEGQQILLTPMAPAGPQVSQTYDAGKSQVLFFYSKSCSHCQTVYENIVSPFLQNHAEQFQFWMLPIDVPANYEALLSIESDLQVQAEERGLPTILIGDQLIIGEEQSNAELLQGLTNAANASMPLLPGNTNIDFSKLQSSEATFSDVEFCSVDDPSACETGEPIYAAYFYQVGCQECSRAEADLIYLQKKYPNLIIEEYNIYDEAGLGEWLAKKAGRSEDFHSPALFINEQAWIGEGELTPQSVEPTLTACTKVGAPRYWDDYDPAAENGIVERFRSMSWLTVVAAGLIDGLNPCAFATLIFFISYLTISGRKGKQIIFVGISFTLGVFLAYLAIGMGFYKVLDALGTWLKIVGQWVIGLTGLLCLVLAVYALLDFFKARKGDIGDMALNLPHALRTRINKVIREGKSMRYYVLGAFVTGVVISVLELACTGQIYLPTIIFVSSIPELKLQAFSYLLLYNLLFITPLVVVFFLAYYGTTSKDLTRFLQNNAAKVKLGMTVLFFALGIWLIFSLF